MQIVEFYAPWCGHCQNLKPAYEKAAKNLAGFAKVAAVDCDEDVNKPLCSQMGVQGFPTLKIVKPGNKPGRPIVEDYNGARATKAIVDAVKDKIPNHVKRLQGEALDKWLNDPTPVAKAIIFTDKGTTSPLLKSLAVDFLGNIAFAQVRDKATAEKYHVTQFPSIRLVSTIGDPEIPYDGEITRDSLVSFFSQIAPPNPDPAPKNTKPAKSTSKKSKSRPTSSASAAFSRASDAHKSSDFDDFLDKAGTIVLDDDAPTASPLPIVDLDEKPMTVPDALPPIPTLSTPAELEAACLTPKSGNCLLLLLPGLDDLDALSLPATSALAGLAEIANKYKRRHADMIPTYAVPKDNHAAGRVRQDLNLGPDGTFEIVVTNVKRGWWRRYSSGAYDILDLEGFIDAVKLGEGIKSKLPTDFGGMTEEKPQAEAAEPVVSDAGSEEALEKEHDEL